MIGTLAWKDYREHQTVWAAMAGLAVLLIVALTQVFAPNGVAGAPTEKLHTIAVAALILAGTYGLICGAMMLAGEHEARTQTFLDTLPASRMRVWITKLLMGALFTLAHSLVLTGVLVLLGLTEVKALPAGWQLALPLVALEAFACGLLGSAMGRSVLGACGWALVPVMIGWIIGGEVDWPPRLFLVEARSIFLFCMLGLSAWIFCRPDFQRLGGSGEDLDYAKIRRREGWGPDSESLDPQEDCSLSRLRRDADSSTSQSWAVLHWLALRQGWPRFLLLAIAGFVCGLLLPNGALAIWPVASLLVGVVFGTGMFGGEQAGEAYRFLGNQRLPAARVWLAKAIAWSAMAAGVLLVMLLGAIVHGPATPHGSGGRSTGTFLGSQLLLERTLKGGSPFLYLWPVYGFAVGQFLSLVCRKSAVALVLSLLISVPLVGIWIPSLVTGGLKLWQVLPVAAFLLLATRLGLWAWTADLLKTGRAAFGFVSCTGLAGTWLAGNLLYRAIEIPDWGPPFDVAGFVAGTPMPEQNQAGSLIRRAAQDLTERERLAEEKGERLTRLLGMEAQGPPMADTAETPVESPEDPIARVLDKGWPENDAEFDSWLEDLSHGRWIDDLRQAASLPLGMVQDPRLLSGALQIESNPVYERLAQLLVARALQIQARGDHASALDHIAWALALSRNLRFRAVTAFYLQGQTVEAVALKGLDRWLERLGPQTQFLQRALDNLNRHEEETPSITEPVKAEYLILRDRLNDPARWLVREYSSATAALEHDLITLALQAPCERARAVRFLDALTNSRLKEAETPYWQLPVPARYWSHDCLADETWLLNFVPAKARIMPFGSGTGAALSHGQWERLLADSRLLLRLFALSPRLQPLSESSSLCRVRGARLKLALALYQINEGKPASTLVQVVPRYLEELPLDPFSGGQFHYRNSTSQRMERRSGGAEDYPAWTEMAARQSSIVWSAGAQARGRSFASGFLASDQVFLVPSWNR